MIHKRIKFALSLVFFLFIQIFFAQVTITVPSANNKVANVPVTEWRKPFGTYDGYERTAIIYQHSEITQLGQINSIAFFCDTSIHNPGTVPVKIYMKERTDVQFLQTSTVAEEETGALLVYSGTIPSSAFISSQWVTINLSTPFIHATTRSVEVIIETNAGGTGNEVNIYSNNTGLSKSFYHHYVTLYAWQFWGSDNAPPTNTGTMDGFRPNTQFSITTLPNCSGTPTAGSTLSSVDTTCSEVSLSLQGNTAALNLSYQWQDSISGGAWTNILNANYSTLTTSIGTDTWFRCKVGCSAQAAYSTVKGVILRNYMQCFCFSGLGGGCSFGSAIDSVAISGTALANGLTGCSANDYTLYPAFGNTCAQVLQGQNYNLHTRFNGNVIASVWIDYNQNGIFDTTEWKQICLTSKADSDYVISLSVPLAAKTGLTLMRIRSRASGNTNDSTSACSNFGSGETEDYFIGINYPVGISHPGLTKDLVLYPNPASNALYVAGNFIINEQVILSIYSLNGRLISQTESVYHGKPFVMIVSSIEEGIYFLKLTGKDISIVKKVVISR